MRRTILPADPMERQAIRKLIWWYFLDWLEGLAVILAIVGVVCAAVYFGKHL